MHQYDASGVPFRAHLHVPEVHLESDKVFMEGEDEGHMLKVRICVFVHYKEVMFKNCFLFLSDFLAY